jgi:dipeptidyl aminopeptidase/acylaminoacyl peptidase
MNALYWVHLPSGRTSLLDTLTVFSDYEDITWSPDSRALVVTRVTATEVEGEPTASDLWLFDSSGQRCELTKTKDYLESEPKWINGKAVVFSRRKASDPDLGNPERRVITLTRNKTGTAAK